MLTEEQAIRKLKEIEQQAKELGNEECHMRADGILLQSVSKAVADAYSKVEEASNDGTGFWYA